MRIKGAAREKKRLKARQMRVSGRSVFTIQQIIGRKAQAAKAPSK